MTNVASILLPALVMISVTNKSVSLAWNGPSASLFQLQESDDLTNWRWVQETSNLTATMKFYGTNTAGKHYFRVRTILYSPFSNIASITNK